MMSGKRYQVFMSPSAHRRYKKFDTLLQRKITEEAVKLAEDPYQCDKLKGPLRGIRSYHFIYEKTQYRIAYRILEDKSEVEVMLVKSREGFYQALRRIIK